MRKFFTLTAFFLSALNLSAQPLQNAVEKHLKTPALLGAWWGGLAQYQQGGKTLFAVNEDQRMAPASALKIITTAAALEKLGPEHRFQTRLYAQNKPDENGVLRGNLYLRGGGDMTLGSKRVKGAQTWQEVAQRWIKAIQGAGIKRVEGSIIADVSLFEGLTIARKVNWENMGNYFASPASALCFNDNLFEIHFAPQPLPNQKAEVAFTLPQVEGLTLESFVTTDGKSDKDDAYVYGAPQQYTLKIFGTIPVNATGFTIKGALPDPALFTAQTLTRLLAENQITITAPAQTTSVTPDYENMVLLDTYVSPALKDIVWVINKRSFNLYADVLLRHLALADGQTGTIENGIKAVNRFMQDKHLAMPQDLIIYDGSGLSRDNMVTPRVLVNVLNFVAAQPYFNDFYRSLATANDRGDLLVLRYFLQPRNKMDDVHVKGGTIDSVKALAGYTRDADGNVISFALMANNLPPETNEKISRMHENIIKEMMSFSLTD
jgi:D-alanyl-D-alanine carboxypeptidase/D-alanyl-D-alanine-endopeptidase (penicillin-binding protein 4)